MKKKFFAAILMAMALAAFSLAACDDPSVTPLTPVADIPDAATVEVGGLFDFETAAVAKGDKVYLPKSVTITFGENENVEFTGTSFSPAKVGVYTITYTFDIDGETKAYTTAVTARDTTKPSILLSSAIPVRAEYNARLTLPTFTATDICDGSLTADVKVYENNADKTPIAVIGGEFTVNTYDGVVIEATATDAAGNTALDQYTVAVRGEREVDYFENEPYALANAVGFGGGKTEYNADPEYAIQGEGSLKFYTDINGKWVFCGFPSIGEAVRLAGGKDAFKTEYSAITLLLYNASPYDCEIEVQYWKRNPQNGLAQDAKLIQKNQLIANCWTKISVPTDKIAEGYADDMFFGLFFNGGNHEANNAYANFCVYADCMRLSKSSDVASVDITLTDIMMKTTGSEDVTLKELSAFGDIDLTKLAVSAQDKNGTPATVEKTQTAFVLKNASEGRYTVQYMYANGENIDVFSQTVTLYAPLADSYFEGFEGGGYTHTLAPLSGNASVEVSTEQVRSGTHALKVTTGRYRYTSIPLMLDSDMLTAITTGSENVELSVWLYIDGQTDMTYKMRVAGLKNKDGGGYESGDWAMTGGFYEGAPQKQWVQIKFGKAYNEGKALNQLKQSGGMKLEIEIASTATDENGGESDSYPFTYYVDDLEVTEPDAQVTMTFEDKTAKFTSGMTVELADFSDREKFTGINTEKLTITCNGKAFDYTIEGDKLQFTPAAAGIYEFAYTHKDGHKIKTATQTVTVYTPLADPYFDGFEGGGRTHTLAPLHGSATVEVSTEQARSGMHSLKVTTGINQDVPIPLMLDEDMLAKITTGSENVELSLWLYVVGDSSTSYYIRFNGLKYENGSYNSGDWAMGYNDTFGNNMPAGQWLQVKYGVKYNEGKALVQLKQSGGILMNLDMGSAKSVTYYIDDIEVTDVDTAVTITAEDKSVPFAGGGTSIEIASFTGSNFNADCLTVTMNGSPYTFTLNENKLSFTPTATGNYVFVYTHKNGHMVKTATQTVTVFDPTFDGFESDNHATVEGKGDVTASVEGGDNFRTGEKGLWCNATWLYTSVRIKLNQDMINAIGDNSTVSYWIKIKSMTDTSKTGLVHSYSCDGSSGESWDTGLSKQDGTSNWNFSGADVGTWKQITISNADMIAQIKQSGELGIWVQSDDVLNGGAIQFCVDDIQVTNA